MQAFAFEAWRELSTCWIWPFLLHSVWIGLIAASLAALRLQAGVDYSHRTRHGILLGAFALVVVCPFFATALQRAVGIFSSDGTTSAEKFIAQTNAVEATVTPGGHEIYPIHRVSVRSTAPRSLHALWGPLAKTVWITKRVRPYLIAVWLFCIVSIAGYIVVGTRTLRRLLREAEPAAPAIQQKARALAQRLRLPRVPPVLVHMRVEEPFLGGMFRPAILLPGRWIAGVRGDCMDAILAHELAHVRRFDHFVNLAQRLIEMLLFFHPAVHWLSRSLRRQREFCADALAVRLTNDPLALAGALESVALFRLSSSATPPFGSSLGGQSSSLLPRIQELLGMKPSRSRFRFWPLAALPAAGVIALFSTWVGASDERPGASTPPRSIATKPDSRRNSEPMISYEVRWISSPDAQPWRDMLQDRLKLVSQEGDVCAWIVDDTGIHDLLSLTINQSWVNVLQTPKAVGFENATITIENVVKQSYVARVEKVANVAPPAFRPILQDIEVGVRLEMKGTLLGGRTVLGVKLHDTDLLAMHTLRRRDRYGSKLVAAEYQVPTPLERRCQATCEIPAGSSLLISLGMRERRGRSSDAAETASEILELVGLPPLPARTVTCERLVSITPRRVVSLPGRSSTHDNEQIPSR